MPVNNEISELLYGKKLVDLLRAKATEIRKSATTLGYTATAQCIFSKTGFSVSDSTLARTAQQDLAVGARNRNIYAQFLELPVESIELLLPVNYGDIAKRTKKSEQLQKQRHQISNHAAKSFITQPFVTQENIMSKPEPTSPKHQFSLSDLSPEDLQAFLAQLPSAMLKEAANAKEKTHAQLIAEKEKAYAELEAQIIPKSATAYLDWVEAGKELKAELFSDLKALMDLKFELVDFKDKQVLETLKAKKSITFNVSPFILRVGRRAKDTFNHDAKVGLAKIEEYINSQQLDPSVSSLLISLIEKDNNGNLTPSSILSLQKAVCTESNPAGIDDESFKEGVRLLTKSWKKLMSCFYIEVGKQDNLGKTEYQPGSFSAYDVPVDFTYFQDDAAEAEVEL